jgi:organic hydroperoxide reductase OsmC/OhrA
MAIHTADVAWTLKPGEDFAKGRYSRGHTVSFDGGLVVSGSAAPQVVGKWAVAEAADPEEMLLAAISACHMMSFLHVVRLAGFVATAYRDRAVGTMETIAPGRVAMTKAVLHPAIEWAGDAPDSARLEQLHHAAHETCYIANSVKTEITVA